MKILIVSDTHRHIENFKILLDRVGTIDMLIHLGDMEGREDDIKRMVDCPVEMVSGNNDFFARLPRELLIKIGRYNVFMSHGHLYYVNNDFERIINKAKDIGADIVMFGHTHRPIITRRDDLVILNPGSLTHPRQEKRIPTYIIMEIDEKGDAHFSLNYLKSTFI